MKIASNGGIPKSSVARAEAHCTPFRPCAIPPVCLIDGARHRLVGAGNHLARLSPVCLPYAGRRPAHPGRPRGRKMVTGEPDRNLTSPNPPPIRRDSGQDSDCRL
jgi:hypothetical protein